MKTINEDEFDWTPFCGAIYLGGKPGSAPVICTIEQHDLTVKHLNIATGFSWWDENHI